MKKSGESFSDQYSDDPMDSERPKGGAFSKLFSFIGIAAVLVVGSTFAASINLNSGRNVEFGQGVSNVTACDNDVRVTPYSNFSNASGNNGSFYFDKVKISQIDAESCNGRSFIIKAWKASDQNPLTLFGSNTVAVLKVASVMDTSTNLPAASFSLAIYQGSLSISDSSTSSISSASAILNFGTPASAANLVYKITLQSISSNAPQMQPVTLQRIPGIQVANGSTACPYGGFGGYASGIGWGSGYFCSPFPDGSSTGVENDVQNGLFYILYGYDV